MTSPLTQAPKLSITIKGVRPSPQGSLGFNRQTGRPFPASRGLRAWRKTVAEYAHACAHHQRFACDPDVPVAVTIIVGYKRPASHFRGRGPGRLLRSDAPSAKTSPPDLDKIVRSTLDGLVDGGVLHDDRQVAWITAEKCWGSADTVEILVRRHA